MTIKKENINYKRLRKTIVLRDVVAKIAKPLFKQRQVYLVDLVTHWADVVGQELASMTTPLKLHRRQQQFYQMQEHCVLTIAAHHGYGTDLVHQQVLILDRVNQYLGKPVVQSLHFVTRLPQDGVKVAKQLNNFSQLLDKKQTHDTSYKDKINDIVDDDLKLALMQLGDVLHN